MHGVTGYAGESEAFMMEEAKRQEVPGVVDSIPDGRQVQIAGVVTFSDDAAVAHRAFAYENLTKKYGPEDLHFDYDDMRLVERTDSYKNAVDLTLVVFFAVLRCTWLLGRAFVRRVCLPKQFRRYGLQGRAAR